MREPSPLEQLEEITMPWYVYFAYFFGGAFLANALPHLIAGVSGQPLQTPFASPPFKGLSPPAVNVAWALANLAFAYLLLVRVEALDLRSWSDVGVCFLGFGAMALQCSRSLARLREQALP
ncbi:hypothetical protein WMF11_00765 [Sorangium sp. So ce295]|uniref:hypothetical protein n=1 Tax=Sorangium sp. So ce295 TaxID=3133295 RepID=UPI003F604F84